MVLNITPMYLNSSRTYRARMKDAYSGGMYLATGMEWVGGTMYGSGLVCVSRCVGEKWFLFYLIVRFCIQICKSYSMQTPGTSHAPGKLRLHCNFFNFKCLSGMLASDPCQYSL